MIYILTGEVQTGKSTALSHWIQAKSNVVGILSLVNADGKRDFINIRNQETFSMHVNHSDANDTIIHVGTFNFSKQAFKKANGIIASEGKQADYQYLVVDELGKLELKQEGLYPSTIDLIKPFENSQTRHLILVIRAYLLDDIVELYQISSYLKLDKSHLNAI